MIEFEFESNGGTPLRLTRDRNEGHDEGEVGFAIYDINYPGRTKQLVEILLDIDEMIGYLQAIKADNYRRNP